MLNKKNRTKTILLFMALTIATSSCGIGMPIMNARQREVLKDIETLKEESQEIKETLTGNASEVKATLAADISTMREEFSFVKGENEESQRLIEELRVTTEDIEARLIKVEKVVKEILETNTIEKDSTEALIAALTTDVSELKKSAEKVNDRLVTLEKQKSKPDKSKSNKDTPKTMNPEEMYNKAYAYINKKKHKTAIKKMREFLKTYPTHSLADNALYWIGEIHYADSEWSKAILEFENVQEKYPKGDKTPAALLKQGYAFLELGETGTAKIVLKKVISKFPNSSEAEKAKRKLKKL